MDSNRPARSEFGNYLRSLREHTGLSQRGMARAVGISPSYANELEHGYNRRHDKAAGTNTWKPVRLRAATVANLCRALHLSPENREVLYWLAGLSPPAKKTLEDLSLKDRRLLADVARRFAARFEMSEAVDRANNIVHRVERFGPRENSSWGETVCIRCGKLLVLFDNGGEGDQQECCGLWYWTYHVRTDLLVTDHRPWSPPGR